MYRSGFTLTELLISIAIIGVLVSVILPRLDNAREQGIEAKVVTELDAFHKNAVSAEILAGTYNVVCGMNGSATSTSLLNIVESLTSTSDQFVCNSTFAAFAASAEIELGRHYCVDSINDNGEITTALTPGDTTCS